MLPALSPEHLQYLNDHAIPPGVAEAHAGTIAEVAELPEQFATYGEAAVPAIVFQWDGTDGKHLQLRPDQPLTIGGKPAKYVFGAGDTCPVGMWMDAAPEPDAVLIVEGTKQSLAAASVAHDAFVIGVARWTVLGIPGARGWQRDGVPDPGLGTCDGFPVVIVLDADAATNRNVYDAGVGLRDACLAAGATDVRFARVPGGAKAGLDDVLAAQPSQPAEKRVDYLARLIEMAKAKPADVKPKPKARSGGGGEDGEGEGSPYFGDEGLKVQTLAEAVQRAHPVALTAENRVAVYRAGAYRIEESAFMSEVAMLLGEAFRIGHHANAEAFTISQLIQENRRLPMYSTEPVLNLLNGMLNLRTGEMVDHSPEFMSSVQFPVEWVPGARAPVYEAWLAAQAGEQADQLEELAGLMLDPTITPTKAMFLFGPARSGKSTFLRLLALVAGIDNTSAVSLHQLAEDKFAAADLFGKALNISADLSSAHVEDVSLFKMMTGQDPIQANRKYGKRFAFTSRALFAFSANTLPTVGENSRAYAERMVPIKFGRSFAGAEDPGLEVAMVAELPAILARWVAAYRRWHERGSFLATPGAVAAEFEMESNRVAKWLAETCSIVTAGYGETIRGGMTKREAHASFVAWARATGGHPMQLSRFVGRLLDVSGVVEVRTHAGNRVLNVESKPETDKWEETMTQADEEVTSKVPEKVMERARPAVPAVSDHSYQSVEQPLFSEPEEKVFISDVARNGLKLPELPGSVSSVTSWPAPVCTRCKGLQALIPPALILYACPHCYPSTFPEPDTESDQK